MEAWFHHTAARLRALLVEESDFATVLRGAGLVIALRLATSAVGFISVVLLARWMGASQYGLYSFAVTSMLLLAYPATLGLHGAAVRIVAQHAAVDDWSRVAGFMRSSWLLALGFGVLIALVAMGTAWALEADLDPSYFAPTVLALAGVPIVAVSIVRSEAIRALGWIGLAWGPIQLGQPLLLLAVAAVVSAAAAPLTATVAVGASILAYAAMLLLQSSTAYARLKNVRGVKPTIQLRAWLGVARSFLWISLAALVLLQAGVVVAGAFLKPEEVAIYSAAAATAGFVSLPVYAGAARGAPKFAALHTQHRLPELQKLFSDIVRWALWPSLAIALAFGTLGAWILSLFGPGFERGYPVLLVLTLGLVSGAFVGPAANLLTMTGHQVLTARVQASCAVLAVVAGLIFTPIWGIIGTAAAFASATALMNVWLMLSARRELGLAPFSALS